MVTLTRLEVGEFDFVALLNTKGERSGIMEPEKKRSTSSSDFR